MIKQAVAQDDMRTKRQYKRILCTLCILFLLSGSAAFAETEVVVYVNGTKIVSDTPAMILSERTMLPFRSILNALGVSNESITWNAGSRSIEIRHDGTYIFLMIGSTFALVNDIPSTLDAPPCIRDDRTLVPVRFIAESLKAEVAWDAETKTVYITR